MTAREIGVHGLDLSLTCTGVCTPRGVHLVPSEARKTASLDERHERLIDLRSRITDILFTDRAPAGDLVVVEGPAFAATGGSQWDRAGLWWLMQDRLRQLGYVVAQIAPSTLKKYATGNGRAGKGAMADAAARRIPGVHTGGQDDAVDALWLRAAGLEHLGRPLAKMPAEQRAVLDKVPWPVIAS